MKGRKEGISVEERFYIASQWQLMWRKFIKHKLAILGGTVLAIFYIITILCEFFSTYDIYHRYSGYIYCPPQRIRFFDEKGFHFRPFVYGFKQTRDPETFRRVYKEDKTKKYPIYLLKPSILPITVPLCISGITIIPFS